MHRSNQRNSPVELDTDNNDGLRHSARLQERENQGAKKKYYYGPRIYRGRKNYPHAENLEAPFTPFLNNAWEPRCPPRMQGNPAWQRPQNFRQNSYSECYTPDNGFSDDVPKAPQKKRRNRRKKNQAFVADRSMDSNAAQSTFNNEDKYRLEQTVQDLTKEKEELLREKGHLRMLLNKQSGNPPLKQGITFQNEVATEVQYKLGKLMESELTCTICTEFFVKATTLSCSHTFCLDCISVWRTKKNHCPICRTKINGLSSCMVIDNLIDKMVENLSTESQKARKSVVAERAKPKENKKQERRTRNSHGGDIASAIMYYALPLDQDEYSYDIFGNLHSEYPYEGFFDDEFSLGETSDDDDTVFNACEACGMQGHRLSDCPFLNS